MCRQGNVGVWPAAVCLMRTDEAKQHASRPLAWSLRPGGMMVVAVSLLHDSAQL